MDPLSKGTLVVASSFSDMKLKYHMVYHFLFKRARSVHIIISHMYNTKFNFPVKHGLSVDCNRRINFQHEFVVHTVITRLVFFWCRGKTRFLYHAADTNIYNMQDEAVSHRIVQA